MTDSYSRSATAAAAAVAQIAELYRRWELLSEDVDGDEEREAIETEMQGMPLSVEVRRVWHVPGAKNAEADEYALLLCTGGPAVRVWGKLDAHDEPYMAVIESQDWIEPWHEYQSTTDKEREALLWFANLFYYGEG